MSSESDALTIARWCWPHQDEWAVFDTNDPRQVGWAERVLIERGHAEEYGRALLSLSDGIDAPTDDDSSEDYYTTIAKIATAPLDARVRAMAATIRAQEAKP